MQGRHGSLAHFLVTDRLRSLVEWFSFWELRIKHRDALFDFSWVDLVRSEGKHVFHRRQLLAADVKTLAELIPFLLLSALLALGDLDCSLGKHVGFIGALQRLAGHDDRDDRSE